MQSQPNDALVGSLLGRRILVTGGAGFIGARIVRMARFAGADVVVLSRPGSSRVRLEATPGWTLVEVDLQDADTVRAIVATHAPEILIHLAAITNWQQDPSLTLKMVNTHVVNAAHVLEAARLAGVGRVVLLGSAGEYGAVGGVLSEDGPARPVDPYSVTKLGATELARMYHRSFGLACTIVRPFVVYGPGEAKGRLLPTVFSAARSGGGEIAFTAGTQVRDFVHVDEVAEGILRAAIEPGASGETLNLGRGIGLSVRQVVERAVAISGDVVIPRFGSLPSRRGEPEHLVADMTKTRRVLGWAPICDVEEGLRALWAATSGVE